MRQLHNAINKFILTPNLSFITYSSIKKQAQEFVDKYKIAEGIVSDALIDLIEK